MRARVKVHVKKFVYEKWATDYLYGVMKPNQHPGDELLKLF
jgi:hypothetical protein